METVAAWESLAAKIKPHAADKFNPERPLRSGPQHKITIFADGFAEEDAFTHHADITAAQRSMLDSLATGTTPAEYVGGKCPHSVLLYVNSGPGGAPAEAAQAEAAAAAASCAPSVGGMANNTQLFGDDIDGAPTSSITEVSWYTVSSSGIFTLQMNHLVPRVIEVSGLNQIPLYAPSD